MAAFYQQQLKRLSPGSVRRVHALLRRALTVAERWQLIGSNPIAAVDPPAHRSGEVHPYNAAEALRFLAAVRGHRFEARWMLAIMLGMRQGGALADRMANCSKSLPRTRWLPLWLPMTSLRRTYSVAVGGQAHLTRSNSGAALGNRTPDLRITRESSV